MPSIIPKSKLPDESYTKILCKDKTCMMCLISTGIVVVPTDSEECLYSPWTEIVQAILEMPERKPLEEEKPAKPESHRRIHEPSKP